MEEFNTVKFATQSINFFNGIQGLRACFESHQLSHTFGQTPLRANDATFWYPYNLLFIQSTKTSAAVPRKCAVFIHPM